MMWAKCSKVISLVIMCCLSLSAIAKNHQSYSCDELLTITKSALDATKHPSLEEKFKLAVLNDHTDDIEAIASSLRKSVHGRALIQKELTVAAWAGNTAALRVLIQNGASPRGSASEHENPPLFAAASCGRLATMRVLVEHGARVNAAPRAAHGRAASDAFEYAILGNQNAAAQWLLDHGFKFCSVEGKERASMAHELAVKQHMAVAKSLTCASSKSR